MRHREATISPSSHHLQSAQFSSNLPGFFLSSRHPMAFSEPTRSFYPFYLVFLGLH